MADGTIATEKEIERIKKYNNELDRLIKNIKTYKDSGDLQNARKSEEGFRSKKNELIDYIKSLGKVHLEAIKAAGGTNVLAKASTYVKQTVTESTTSLQKNNIFRAQFNKRALESVKALGLVGVAAGLVGSQLGQDFLDPTKDSSDAVSSLGKTLQGVTNRFGSFGKVLSPIFKAFSGVNTLIKNYRGVLTDVNQIEARFGNAIDSSHKKTTGYLISLENLSAGLGFNSSTMRRVVQDAQDVPKVFDKMSQATVSAARGAKNLAGLMLVLRGAGLDASRAGSILNERYRVFGERTAKTTSEQILKMSNAAKSAGISINIAQEQIKNASDPLTIFGKKSAEATRVWKTFVDTLGDSIPIQKVGSLLSNLTRGIGNMSLENRAFLSMVSGFGQGMGALSGGLHMELMLRQKGGLEKNVDALMQAVAKFGGGQITTLQEAVNTPGLATQFEVQRKLLGQMINVQGQDAARMLEVLKGVQTGGISQVEASKTLQNMTQKGATIQDESKTSLERLGQIMKRTADLTSKIVEIESGSRNHIRKIESIMSRGLGMNNIQDNPILNKENISDVGGQFKKISSEVLNNLKKFSVDLTKIFKPLTTHKLLNQPTVKESTITPETEKKLKLTATSSATGTLPNIQKDFTAGLSKSTSSLQKSTDNLEDIIKLLLKPRDLGEITIKIVDQNGNIKKELYTVREDLRRESKRNSTGTR